MLHAIVNEKFPNYQSHFQLINIDLNISASNFRENPDNHEFIPKMWFIHILKSIIYMG